MATYVDGATVSDAIGVVVPSSGDGGGALGEAGSPLLEQATAQAMAEAKLSTAVRLVRGTRTPGVRGWCRG